MYKKIDAIVHLFPDFEQKIRVLFEIDEDFRQLCFDYMLCISMISDRQEQLNKNIEEIAEFEEIESDMKQEILKEISRENITL